MNLDFILFNAPKSKSTFLDFWGEIIFIPSYSSSLQLKQTKTNILGSFVNCYKASTSTDVYFSIENALCQQSGQLLKTQPQTNTLTTDSTHDQQQLTHYIPCLFLNSMVNSKYLIIYFHASGQDIKSSYGLLNFIRNSFQINVLAMEYPGYSIYKGTASTDQVNSNALVVYEYMTKKLGFHQQHTIIIGRSIGTGVALELLKKKKQQKTLNPLCLVLISPFASIKNLVRQFIGKFGTYLAKQTYDNLQSITSVKCPVFMVHGRKDTLISVQHSKQLIKNCTTKKCLISPQYMTHASFDYYSDLIDPLRQFLSQEGVNFYQQNMKGPSIPQQLFKCPNNFKF